MGKLPMVRKKCRPSKVGRIRIKRGQQRIRKEGAPKQVPRTIENSRIVNETRLQLNDAETLHEVGTDEVARAAEPRVLITSSDRPSLRSNLLMRELNKCIPSSNIKLRCGIAVKKIVSRAIEERYNSILIINEDRKIPNGLLIINLPDGPSAYFKLSSFRRSYDIRNHGRSTSHTPELILNNFTTRLGHSVGCVFASLFPSQPHFKGRQVVTFHNQRDYIFFRYHRYIFRNAKRVGIQELGPRFTIKLQSLQKGTFNSKYGEYMWLHKKEDKKTKRKFYL